MIHQKRIIENNIITIYINGKPQNIKNIYTILQVCLKNNIEIPRFCYYEKLSIAGNCRMCMVEILKNFKPVISCATTIMQQMHIYTDTALVKNAREHILEFLLINHPLDCPICDQAGECDLQDQTIIYGSDRGRFKEKKRSVIDKNLGLFIKTIMTRCIHCTRCIRFSQEIANNPIIGTNGRGKNTEIGMYINNTFDSILSGNLIDICPVGALTSKPYAFTARSWELRNTETIDILDSTATAIRVDIKGSEIMRILPKTNNNKNENWITDKIRFCYDSLKKQRITLPIIRKKNMFINSSWQTAFNIIKQLFVFNIIKKKKILLYLSNLLDIETILIINELLLNSGVFYYFNNNKSDNINVLSENSVIYNIEKTDSIINFFLNIDYHHALVFLKIKNIFKNDSIYYIGFKQKEQNIVKIKQLGINYITIYKIFTGKHFFNSILQKNNKKKLKILQNKEMPFLKKKKISYAIYNIVIYPNVAEINKEIIMYSKNNVYTKYTNDSLYIIGNINKKIVVAKKNFIVFQGHHGDLITKEVDLILPTTTFLEKNAFFFSQDFSPIQTKNTMNAPGETKNDSIILFGICALLRIKILYNKKNNNIYFFSLKKISIEKKKNILKINKKINHISIYNYLYFNTDIISKTSTILGSVSIYSYNNFF